MSKKIKASSLLLAALMLVSAVGCSPKSEPAQTTVAQKSGETSSVETKEEATAKAEVKKPAKIVAMTDYMEITEADVKQVFLDKYKEITGIELELQQPPHNQYYEKVNLAFASGDLPDVVQLAPSDNSAYMTYSSEGALYDITSLVEQSEYLKAADKQIIDGLKIDGVLYGCPADLGNGTVTFSRKDWMDKLGIKAPTNYSEYLDMLRAFTFNDPDGNGKADTKGFTGAGIDNISDNYRYLLDFMQDAVPAFLYKDGKWVDGFTEPEMKLALERLKAAYEEGIIDKDLVTNKTSTARDKLVNQEVGVMAYWAGQWNDNLQQRIAAVNPEAKIITLPAINEVTYINRVPSVYAVTTASENPDAAYKYFVELMHDGGEGQKLFTYGMEGYTYEVVNGKGQMLTQKSDPTRKYMKTIIAQPIQITPIKDDVFDPNPVIEESMNIFKSKMVQATMPKLTPTFLKMNADIIQARSSVFAKIVLGELSIDEGLANYKKQVEGEFQMAKILEEMNAK